MELAPIPAEAATETRARFTIEARALADAVKLLSGKVTESRQIIPILSCLLIEAAPCGRVTITATDLNIWATVTLAADPSEEIEPGALCLDADALAKMLAKVAKNSDRVRIEGQDGNRASLKAGRNSYKLPGLPRDDFPMPKAADLDCVGLVDRAQFLADLKALAPAVSTEETRYYLNGFALQVRELGGAARFVMVATDGQVIGATSRPIPAGLEGWQDATLPRKTGAVLLAADKVAGECAGITLSRFGGMIAAEFAYVRIVSKLIDGAFPDWRQAFERIATPTGEIDAPMFPELLPGAPVAGMEKLAKSAPGPVTWENGNSGLLGTVAGDQGFLLACARGALSHTGRNGFSHNVGGHAEATAYLEAIAEGLGLPSKAEMAARVEAINAQWGERDLAALNQDAPHCTAYMAGDYAATYRHSGVKDSGLITRGDRILGYTVGGFMVSQHWIETRQNWETLSYEVVSHPETAEVIEGSYSVLMPDHGPKLEVRPDHYVDASDGHRYPIADNGSKIHLSAEQLRALIGDSVWEVLEFPGPDGKPRYVSAWVWEQGDSRLLCVGKDGRCPKADAPREYVTRAEVEAALAGEAMPVIEAPVPVAIPTPVAPEAVSAPQTAEECAEAAPMLPDTPEAPAIDATPASCQPEPETLTIWQRGARLGLTQGDEESNGEFMLRVEALEAALPAQAVAGKRTPAHERAIRRAWAERKARRMAEAERDKVMAAYNASGDARRALRKERDDWEGRAMRMAGKRRRAVVQARNAKHTARHFLHESLANYDRRINAEHEARVALAAREDLKRMHEAAERRAAAAEAENAQLWAEIEALTAPVAALAA